VVPGSPVAQGTPAEEQQQDHDVNNEDKDDEDYSPLSDNEGKKLYRDAFSADAPVPTGRLCALLEHLGITSTPDTKSRESRVEGWMNSKLSQRSSPGPVSFAGTRGQPLEHLSVMLWLTPSDRPSLLGAVAIGMSYRTPSTASCLSKRRTSSRPLGEEGCPQDGDGTPSGCDGGAERLPADCLVRDRVSPHLDV
jgi:hypothetical protein